LARRIAWQKSDYRKASARKRAAPVKRKVQTEDIIKEVKRHSYYLKPGEKRRVKQALARKRAKKKIRKDRDSRPDRD